jgi:predicted transglutaminase-like cysteine proteinase
LRLSVVKTASDAGHLVLVVATTAGDIVLDNLTDAIRPWKHTSYRWLKIQSSSDARFWSEIREPMLQASAWQPHRKPRLAVR